jgi:predicted RND superfamily exporter protein
MWRKIAHFILQYRVALLCLLLFATAFMGWQGRKAEMSYDFAKIVPDTDADMQYFIQFKTLFGQDDNVLVVGSADKRLFEYQNFNEWVRLRQAIANLQVETPDSILRLVKGVVGLAGLPYLKANRAEKRFEVDLLLDSTLSDQTQLDSLLDFAKGLKLYQGQIYNPESQATLLAISLSPAILSSPYKHLVVAKVEELGNAFEAKTNIKLHYAGVPYVRSIVARQVKTELNWFLMLSVGVTAIFLFVFFRSFSATFVPLLLIGIIIIWTVGTLGILGYKITLLTGLLPPILVVIGIPNCIYLLTKYHQECLRLQDKKAALSSVIEKIGIVTLLTNTTTAVGFLALLNTETDLLREFGIVAGVNIFATFLVSLIFIPSVFSFLPTPSERHTKHLESRFVNRLLSFFESLILRHRLKVYLGVGLILVIALVGISQIKAVSYMVDDLPEESDIRKDLAFFERHFKGVMPLEVVVDLGKEKAIRDPKNLKILDSLVQDLESSPYLSQSVSMVSFLKAANQAYFGNNPDDFALPTNRSAPYIQQYLRNEKGTTSNQMLAAFVDSTGQKVRISFKVADIGSIRMDSLIEKELKPILAKNLAESQMQATITGTTPIFIKGNAYLISSLRSSLLLACLLIAVMMGILFLDLKIVLIALIPNVIPLLLTAGLMGYFGVPLKPSTALIFSIAFGISVDDTLHYLTRYHQELLLNGRNHYEAILKSLRETGKSMVYTSLILFAGFVIFTGSDFGGTVALGVLTSTTLLVAMLTNLLVLPSLLMTFKSNK